MRNILTIAAACGLAVGAAACSGYDEDEAGYNNAANASGYAESDGVGNYAGGAGGGNAAGTAAAGGWPAGSRIVVEDGVTYRIEPGGTRVVLGPADSRIVVENDTRFRVDPSGTRVRIDDSGAEIRVGPEGTSATIPVGGNTSVTVNTQ